ncbi:hypothetical protein AJ79_08096 [Helicocarpus griseus UAMH5409]|uniref:Amino acid permease/ SLC12A domain-containing protein n=1 Tax=Helicocarpus griseus UAMH5409 TaxID=1447875 RepID=A0A2B7WN94_9EURO|nr:hypothetical protein AJ79_08096 [Helicocarpus griseus UAMH5409]
MDPTASKRPFTVEGNESSETVIADGNLEFVREKGGNYASPTYQEASGAPVETQSPLGYQVHTFTVVFLNVGTMVGTGVFSTPSSIFSSLGSVGLSLFYWFIGFVISACAQAVFLELASYFPSRSGGEVVYLEQAYPRPKWFFPTAFAVQSVLLSFSSSNASIVLAEYVFRMANREPSAWELKGVAVAGYTFAIILLIFNNRFSLWFANFIGIVKVLTLLFISITGLVVLGGHTKVVDPKASFRDSFEGTTDGAYGITNALVKITFAYNGYQNAFNLVNEVKDPIRTLRMSAPASLIIVAVFYILCNIAYFAAVPKDDLKAGKQIAASLFFTAVFGSSNAARGLNFLIVVSAFGNLVTNLIGQSRLIRECGRQGVIPFPRFWASTRPFGTPLGPYFLKWAATILMILAPPAGDAFNFAVDVKTYPEAVFYFCMTSGLLLIRRQRKHIGASKTEFRAWNVAVAVGLLSNIFLLVMPWYPPEGGMYAGDVSFWYATYCVVGIAIIITCALYYYLWIHLIPRWKNYQIRQDVLVLENGATTHRLVKVPNEKVAEWDKEHDAVGRLRTVRTGNRENGSSDEGLVVRAGEP